jgi:hypothetical protein
MGLQLAEKCQSPEILIVYYDKLHSYAKYFKFMGLYEVMALIKYYQNTCSICQENE